MKKAAIVIGRAHAGKTTTINKFKRMVKMIGRNKFTLNGKQGYVLSTSFEETRRPVEKTIKKAARYDLLVIATQGPKLIELHKALKKMSFIAKDIRIQKWAEAPQKAKEVLNFLK